MRPTTKQLRQLALRCLALLLFLPSASIHGQAVTDGLQAFWNFDETTGFTAADSSPNGNDGVLVDFFDADSQWVEGVNGNALAFDGSNYAEVPDAPSIGADLVDGFTVATWFRSNVSLAANGSTYRMLEKGDAYFFLQGVGNGGMNLLVKRDGSNVTAAIGQSLEADRWYHIAGVFDGTTLQVYLDGQLVVTQVVGGPIDDAQLPLRIGSDDSGKFFNGAMDELGIWDRPLTQSEILNLMGRDLPDPPSFALNAEDLTRFEGATAVFNVEVLGKEPFQFLWHKDGEPIRSATTSTLTLRNVTTADAGEYWVTVTNELGSTDSDRVTLTIFPVEDITTGAAALWPFDETTGLVAADASGNDNEATLIDFFDDTSHWVEGAVNGALHFDGLGNRAVAYDTADLDLGPEATVAFWLKPDSYGTEGDAGSFTFNRGRIVRKGSYLDVYTVDDPGSVRRTIIANGENAPQTSLALNEWQHFAAVYEADTIQFFKNGFPIGGAEPGNLGAANLEELVIGNFDGFLDTSWLFSGALDELGIWQRPLTELEILKLAGRDVEGAPVVVLHPAPQKKVEGGSASFSVQATGKRPLSFQWLKDGQAIPEANSDTFTIPRLAPEDSGNYSVQVQNDLGSATSDAAELIVEPIGSITSGLVAYWPFDETEGTAVNDASGNDFHGTMQGVTAVPAVVGVVGGAFDFDGLDDLAIVPHDPGLDLTDQASFSAWIRPRTFSVVGGYSRIVRKSVNYDWNILDTRDAMRFFGVNKTAYDAPANSVDLDEWQHVAVVFKAGTIEFFKNGQSMADPVPAALGAVNQDPLVIGNFQPDLGINRIYNGFLDELAIWKRALSPGEVDGIYQNGLLGKPLTSEFEPLTIRSLTLDGTSRADLVFYTPFQDREYQVQWKDAVNTAEWNAQAEVDFTENADGDQVASFNLNGSAATFYRIAALLPPPLFEEDFESGAAGWTHGGFEDLWELGTPTSGPGAAHSGENVYATNLDGNYSPSTDAFLHSPIIDLTQQSSVSLTFWEWRSVDPDPTFHFTVVNVIDPNTGTVIEQLALDAGNSGGWQERSIRLGPDSMGREIILEFRLVSDPFDPREGWYLDDISIRPN